MLAGQDPAFCIGSFSWSGGDIDDDPAQADGVVIGDGGLIGETDAEVSLLRAYFPKEAA